jgi:hypothetical protein
VDLSPIDGAPEPGGSHETDLFHALGPGAIDAGGIASVRYVGRCTKTGKDLSIGPTATAMAEALRLHNLLDACSEATSGFSSAHLRHPAAGKMFGILVVTDPAGRQGTLRAFSGEWDSSWVAPAGWVPSPGHLQEYAAARRDTEDRVAEFTRQIEELKERPTSKPIRRQIEAMKIERRRWSRELTDKIHAAYRFDNALGEILPLTEVQTGSPRPPTGMGDCCAPKLLQAAIRSGLTPQGMVEFWWGSPSAMFPREEGGYYGSCEQKCYPILGFLLRGIEAAQVETEQVTTT